MKRLYRKWCMLLVVTTMSVMMLAGCAQKKKDVTYEVKSGKTDFEDVQSKGVLVVGVTDFAPMDYRGGDSWIGFDAELAKAFAGSIGATVKFKEIDWDKKTELLERGSIDCIWNGMTMTEELQKSISCSEPYLSNAQVVVLRKGEAKRYNTEEACQHLLLAVEAGSTAESVLKEKKYRYTTYSTQMGALESVRKKQTDAAVIDIIMAEHYTDAGQKYSDLGFDIALNDEKFCIGLRKDSNLTEKVNEFLKASYADGTIHSLAEKYNIDDAVLE